MLPFNTSAFSNTLAASDCAAHQKAVVTPFKEEFDGNIDDVMQHIANFHHRCVETGVIEDFNFIDCKNPPPSDIDMDDTKERLAWLSDPRRFTYGNLLIESTNATLEKLQASRDTIRNNLMKFSSPPDPVKMPLASKQLVSFQNRQWIYVLLQLVWTATMKAIMSKCQELHDNDGVVLWFCFLHHFAGTTTETIIEAYSQLSENKLRLSLFNNDILKFTNVIRTPVRRLIKAKEPPTFQHFLLVFHSAMEAPNEEFRAYVISLYSDYRNNGPTKSLSLLDLLDKLDLEYNRLQNLGRWTKKEDSQLLALMSSFESLQTKFSSLQTKYSSLQAQIASKISDNVLPPPSKPKLNKPPIKKPSDPEITEFEGYTWKWCDKCFGGSWNRTHITKEHQPGKGKSKNKKTPPPSQTGDQVKKSDITANIATTEVNLAQDSSSQMDFL